MRKLAAAKSTIFTTAGVHISFDSKRAYWSENGFARLRIEASRMVENGPGSNPRKPYRGSAALPKVQRLN